MCVCLFKEEGDGELEQGAKLEEEKSGLLNECNGYIKKPLNAFMLYLSETRPSVRAEFPKFSSAALHREVGARWRGLGRAGQESYCQRASWERGRHRELYPGWTAGENYTSREKVLRTPGGRELPPEHIKRCRAQHGLQQRGLWCSACRKKKRCLRQVSQVKEAPYGPGQAGREEAYPSSLREAVDWAFSKCQSQLTSSK